MTSDSRHAGLILVLMELLPAIVGGCSTAYVLRAHAGRWSVRPVLGWAGAAFLGLVIAWFVDSAVRSYFGTGARSTPPGHGLIVGLLTGAALGLVGGWSTLVGQPFLSRFGPSGPASSSPPQPPPPTLPLSSQLPTRGGPTVGMVLLALLLGGLVGTSACSPRSEPSGASNPVPSATVPAQPVASPLPPAAASPPRTASPSPAPAASPAASPVARTAHGQSGREVRIDNLVITQR